MPAPVTLAEILRSQSNASLAGVHTAMPAKVVKYDAATQTIDALPVVKVPYIDEDGEQAYDELPVIPNVPVQFPRGGGYMITVPLAAGDFVWLMFCETDMSVWRTTGQVSEPADLRRHGPGYPVAIPGAVPDTVVTTDATITGTDVVIGKDGQEAQVRIFHSATPGASYIKLGRTASDFVALASLVQTALDAIRSEFNSHTHTCAAPASPGSTVVVPMPAKGPVAATLVKAK